MWVRICLISLALCLLKNNLIDAASDSCNVQVYQDGATNSMRIQTGNDQKPTGSYALIGSSPTWREFVVQGSSVTVYNAQGKQIMTTSVTRLRNRSDQFGSQFKTLESNLRKITQPSWNYTDGELTSTSGEYVEHSDGSLRTNDMIFDGIKPNSADTRFHAFSHQTSSNRLVTMVDNTCRMQVSNMTQDMRRLFDGNTSDDDMYDEFEDQDQSVDPYRRQTDPYNNNNNNGNRQQPPFNWGPPPFGPPPHGHPHFCPPPPHGPPPFGPPPHGPPPHHFHPPHGHPPHHGHPPFGPPPPHGRPPFGPPPPHGPPPHHLNPQPFWNQANDQSNNRFQPRPMPNQDQWFNPNQNDSSFDNNRRQNRRGDSNQNVPSREDNRYQVNPNQWNNNNNDNWQDQQNSGLQDRSRSRMRRY